VRGGTSAASDHGLDLVPSGALLEGYVSPRDVHRLEKRYSLEPSPRPNFILRAVEGPWPFAEGATVAPVAIVAVDLLESEDARERRAGEELLKKLVRA